MLYSPGARHQAGAFIPLLAALPSPTGPHQPNRYDDDGPINLIVLLFTQWGIYTYIYLISRVRIIYISLFIWFPCSRFHLLHPGHHYREIHDCLPSILQGQSRGIIRPAAKLLKSLLIYPKLSHSVQCQHKCKLRDTDFIDILEAVAGDRGRFQISISCLIKSHLLLWLIWPYMTLSWERFGLVS